MKHSKPVILLLTVLLAAIAVVFGRNEIGMRNFPFSVVVTSEGAREEIRCMKIWGEYYVFLPSYAHGENARICTNPIYDVVIDGQQLQKDQSCADFPTDTKLELYFRSAGNEGYETVTFVQSGNVATMYVDVPSGSMDYIHEEKGNAEPGWIRVYTGDGKLDYVGAVETLKGRGNATWMDDKKPYSLELNQEADILGLGKANNWILLANTYDQTHLRNKLSFDLAEATGLPFSPDCTWTDLYLNGEYAGLYLLTERNEVHPQRVDIDPEGSFLVSVEPGWRLQEHGYPYVQTSHGTAFRLHHSIIPQSTVQRIMQSAENAILSEDGYDKVSGKRWDELIDIDSWARKYLIEEIFVNSDVGLASEFYFYDEADGLLYAGPIWDMDATFDSAEIPWLSSRAVIAGRPYLTDTADRNLFYALLQKEIFRSRVEELYRLEFRPLLEELLLDGLEQDGQNLLQAAFANQVRWQAKNPLKKMEEVMDFIPKRIAVLDDWWIHGQRMFLVQVQQVNRVWAFAVYPGETLECLPDMDGGIWYRMDTGEILDKTLLVESDLMLTVKEPDKP